MPKSGHHISIRTHRIVIQVTSRKIDATRVSDGSPVHLYLVSEKEHPEEADTMLHLTSTQLAGGDGDAENHAIPVFEVLEVDDNPNLSVVVTPSMRGCDDPWFEKLGEVVEFLSQVLEVSHVLSL